MHIQNKYKSDFNVFTNPIRKSQSRNTAQSSFNGHRGQTWGTSLLIMRSTLRHSSTPLTPSSGKESQSSSSPKMATSINGRPLDWWRGYQELVVVEDGLPHPLRLWHLLPAPFSDEYFCKVTRLFVKIYLQVLLFPCNLCCLQPLHWVAMRCATSGNMKFWVITNATKFWNNCKWTFRYFFWNFCPQSRIFLRLWGQTFIFT